MVKTTLILAAAVVLVVATVLSLADGRHVGVCYGLEGNNLPPPSQVIDLYKRSGIEMLRIYQPVPEVLDALRGSGLSVAVGPINEELQNLAASPDAVEHGLIPTSPPYKNDAQFKWITLGNEVIPGPLATYVYFVSIL